MKKEKILPFISPVLYIALGIFAFVTAETALSMICLLIGGTVAIAGVYNVIKYLRKTTEQNFASNSFVSGFILILIGLALAIKCDAAGQIIPFFLGLLISIHPLLRFQHPGEDAA